MAHLFCCEAVVELDEKHLGFSFDNVDQTFVHRERDVGILGAGVHLQEQRTLVDVQNLKNEVQI